MNKIMLSELDFIDEKTSKEGNKYVRITFKDEEGNKYRTSISHKQWAELRLNADVQYNPETDEITMNKFITLEWNPLDRTKAGKELSELKSGEMNGYKFKYLELSPLIFINNNYITKNEFKRDLGKFF